MRPTDVNIAYALQSINSDHEFNQLRLPEPLGFTPHQTLSEIGEDFEQFELIVDTEYGKLLKEMPAAGNMRIIVDTERLGRLADGIYEIKTTTDQDPIVIQHERISNENSEFDRSKLFSEESYNAITVSKSEIGAIDKTTNLHIQSREFTNLYSRFSGIIPLSKRWNEEVNVFKEIYKSEILPRLQEREDLIKKLMKEGHQLPIIGKKLQSIDEGLVKEFGEQIYFLHNEQNKAVNTFLNAGGKLFDNYIQLLGIWNNYIQYFARTSIIALDEQDNVMSNKDIGLKRATRISDTRNSTAWMQTEVIPFNEQFHNKLQKELLQPRKELRLGQQKANYLLNSAIQCLQTSNYGAAIKEAATAFETTLHDFVEHNKIATEEISTYSASQLVRMIDQYILATEKKHAWDRDLYTKLISAPNAVHKIRNNVVHQGTLANEKIPGYEIASMTVQIYTEAINQIQYQRWNEPTPSRTSELQQLVLLRAYENEVAQVSEENARAAQRKGIKQALNWMQKDEAQYVVQTTNNYSYAKKTVEEWNKTNK